MYVYFKEFSSKANKIYFNSNRALIVRHFTQLEFNQSFTSLEFLLISFSLFQNYLK